MGNRYYKMDASERFWSKVDTFGPTAMSMDSNCWLWGGGTYKDGYGYFKVDQRMEMAHRWSYKYAVGDIPDGLELDHLCRIRNCVRPGHLEAVTQTVNILRGEGAAAQNARKTKCLFGHPFNKDNTYMLSSGRRRCKMCSHLTYMKRTIGE